ncbi:PLD nuclease N-terminal domain-containing protein [Streptomyces abyssomicinicus]|uniref:PLD nuclease N-terminal domain-containing protein n=1 Tax=Streptomyces abyssomicinicus TaxID=574929 RepID=UPI00124F7CA3|nr:PLD nuclease N-terminal domain-containing protein [Streptomyces abyssomicinicus]
MLRILPLLLVLALTIYAFIDCLNTPEEDVRVLPKPVWALVILLLGTALIGPVAWLIAGKVRHGAGGGAGAEDGSPRPRGGQRRQRFVAPDDNPDFLKSLGDETRRKREEPQEKDDLGKQEPRDDKRERDEDKDSPES